MAEQATHWIRVAGTIEHPEHAKNRGGRGVMGVNFIPGAALNTALTPMVIKYAARCTAVLLVVAVGGEGDRRKCLYNKDTYIQSSR